MTAYVIESSGETSPMTLIHCKDEDRDLQTLLDKNPSLLPGDQINPDEPRRWLTIEREMPVPDPNTGIDRWSIDFVCVDQSGVLTFVEVKRFKDTRSRREVVGQMFDYAANGHYYWTGSLLREAAERSAARHGKSLDDALRLLKPDDELGDDEFFGRVAENLREGQIRLVFFLEKAPMELKSVVDFLNKQMERSEVLLVEAKQYEANGVKIVVPQLFGYTEEARRAKRTVNVVTQGGQKQWNETTFFETLERNFGTPVIEGFRKLYTSCQNNTKVFWGRGKATGSFSPKWPAYFTQAPLSFWTDGTITFNFCYINGSEVADEARESLKILLVDDLGLPVPDEYEKSYPNFKYSNLEGGIDKLCTWIENAFSARSEQDCN